MEKKSICSQNEECENCDEISDARMIYKQDKRAHCMRHTETGGKGYVQRKIELLEEGQLTATKQEQGSMRACYYQ